VTALQSWTRLLFALLAAGFSSWRSLPRRTI
jgi:hypothetical protein